MSLSNYMLIYMYWAMLGKFDMFDGRFYDNTKSAVIDNLTDAEVHALNDFFNRYSIK